MIEFQKYELDNGLKLIVHQDKSTPIVAVNLAFDIGARDEDPEMTGLAHYFEHLMFSGSKNAPDYDKRLQMAGGQNNAFTSNDYTNYYVTLPKENLETALWLESDRMFQLNLDSKSLETQRKVVIEEFKQRYLNQPYGDAWMELRALSYENHPYRWATIGKEISHVEKVTLEDANVFYNRFYSPNNCILSIAGDVDSEEIHQLVKKWFEDIPSSEIVRRERKAEVPQTKAREKHIESKVPLDAFYFSFKMDKRSSKEFYVGDLVSDVLGRGESSWLFTELVVNTDLLTEVGSYVTGDRDEGLFVISGKLNEGTKMEEVEEIIWKNISKLHGELVPDKDLQKAKNKFETAHVYGELNVLNKAMNLCYMELLGDVNMINSELDNYVRITAENLKGWSETHLTKEKVCKIYYKAIQNG
tara:strand:+ start:763 stop:2007 length:1245 start_codon:yes stop_codon:yes gene_type:complete